MAAAAGSAASSPARTVDSSTWRARRSALAGRLARARRRRVGRAVALVVDVTEPALTTAAAEAIRPQMRMVSSWTTYYVPGEGNGFGNNINIPARDIDGRNLAPGEWFSFWRSIGPVTVERGYHVRRRDHRRPRASRTAPSAAASARPRRRCSTPRCGSGLEMGIRANHYYYIDRYPDGLDATVYMDDSSVQDMTFRNDTEYPIVIRGFGAPVRDLPDLVRADRRTVVITDP